MRQPSGMILNHQWNAAKRARDIPDRNRKDEAVQVYHIGTQGSNNIHQPGQLHEFVSDTVALDSLAACCGLDYRYSGTGTCSTGSDTGQSVPLVEQGFAIASPGIHKQADLDRMGG